MTADLYMLAQLDLLLQTVAAAVKAVALFFSLALFVVTTIASLAAVTVHFARLIVSEAHAWNAAHGIGGAANRNVSASSPLRERTLPDFPWPDAVLLQRRPGNN